MNNYIIYCTESQTKKALELGAPIEYKQQPYLYSGSLTYHKEVVAPTAEQMIGWLMEMLKITTWHINYFPVVDEYGYIIICEGAVIEYSINEMSENPFKSYKEATLAAIDAALDYLIKNKKENDKTQ